MVKKFFIIVNVLAIIGLYAALFVDDKQTENLVGGFFVIIAAMHVLRAIIYYMISDDLKDNRTYLFASRIVEFDKSKGVFYMDFMETIFPFFIILGLTILYPGIYVSGFYLLCLIIDLVAFRHLENQYSMYD